MEKILIANHAKNAISEIQQIENNVLPRLQELIDVYAVLDLPELDEKTALSLISDKGKTVKEIYETAIVADAFSTGQKNKNFVSTLLELQQPLINEFIKSVINAIKGIEIHFEHQYISYSTVRGYYLSDESKEEIKEKHKLYISNEKDLMLYNAVKDVCTAIDTLNTVTIERSNYNHIERSKSLPFAKTRLESEFNMLQKFINDRSDKIEPDADKIVKYLKEYRQ